MKETLWSIQLLSLFYKWRDWGTESLGDLPKDTQLSGKWWSQVTNAGGLSPEPRHSNLFFTHWYGCAHRLDVLALAPMQGTNFPQEIRWAPSLLGPYGREWVLDQPCDLMLAGPPDNGTTGEHWASWQRQRASPNTSRQNNKHRWLPQLRSLNTEVEHPCLAPCGDLQWKKAGRCYCLTFPEGRSEAVSLVLQDFCRLSQAPSLKEGLFDVSQSGEPPNPTVIFTGL